MLLFLFLIAYAVSQAVLSTSSSIEFSAESVATRSRELSRIPGQLTSSTSPPECICTCVKHCPTFSPTFAPTFEPTKAPTAAPTISNPPTIEPTFHI